MRSDEYNWDIYPKTYAAQVVQVKKRRTLSINRGDFKIVDGVICLKDGLLPLPPNHKLLYEEIIDLAPTSVHEVGCGWGNSLANINILTVGGISVYGSEISQKQIDGAETRHPWLKKYITLNDITKSPVTACDIVFTAAVLMHLSDSNLEKAIKNIAASAKQHILLVENPRRHYPTVFFCVGPEGWEDAKVKEVERDGGQITIISR